VPHVELDPDRIRADLVDQLRGLAERVHDRPALDALALERLEREPPAEAFRLARDLAQAGDDGRAVAGAGQRDDAARAERGEPLERGEDRVDALARVLRAGQQRQRVDRRDRGDRRRGAEPARAEAVE
jgi:hypothetical protein